MSQRKKSKSVLVDNELNDDDVKECVHHILCREGSKIPIKRAELVKHLSTPSNQVNKVIIEANNVLKRLHGLKLVQVDKGGIHYIVVLNEDCELTQTTDLNMHRRMLIAALTHIFMTGSPVKEDDMWKFLSDAGLIEENDHASRKILTNTFTRQMYLTYTKVGEGDMTRHVFDWGHRANEELPKIYLLNKMAEAFQKTPDYWTEQYKMATEEQASQP